MSRPKYLTNVTDISKIYLEKVINQGDIVVDATMGNGYDTKYLAEAVGDTGMVYAFDIQESAIDSTKQLLDKNGLYGNAKLILDGHENILNHIDALDKVSCVIFNLGYLPKGDHSLVTKPETTLKAMEGSLKLIKPNGVVCIAIYTGHDGGEEEQSAVFEFAKNLSQSKFSVLETKFVNQVNSPPQLIMIEKIK